MEIENDKLFYVMISNIPKSYHSSDLRNYFSQFIEAGKFDCFHFRHRPEIRKRLNNNEINNSCINNDTSNTTSCCITKVKSEYVNEFISLYNRKHWIDRSEESLSTLCCISIIKISPKVNGNKYKTPKERIGQTTHSTSDAALGEVDFDGLMELRPPTPMPRGNVGTPIKWFLGVISKLGLIFPGTRKFRRYGENKLEEELIKDEEGYMPPALTSKGCEIEAENEFIKNTAGCEIVQEKKKTIELGDLEEESCEDWERHLALNDDVSNHFERNKLREFECDMEVTWEKGGSGLVFYTDAAYWAKQKGDFDEQTADDWDVDMSIYEHTQLDAAVRPNERSSRTTETRRARGDLSSAHCSTGDMDSRDAMTMRRMQRLREGKDYESVCGNFEKFTKGFGRQYLQSRGWTDGQGIGKHNDGIAETVEASDQIHKYGLGFYGEKLQRHNLGRTDNENNEDSLYQRPNPLTLKYRQKFCKCNSIINKSYGLLISRKDKHGNKSFVPKPSVFGNDSDENDEEINGKKAVNRTIMQESTKLKLKKQTQLEIEAALKQDPTVYEYDEIYEQVHRVKETKADRKKVVKESKYINQLKNATNKRKIETERRTERQVQKEREQENGEFAGKEEFVTNSYKKRMLERQIEDEKDRQQDAMEELLDVRKQTNLNGFYRGLYSQTLKKEENPNINIDCNKKNDPENKDSQPERKSPTTSKDCRKEKLNERTHQRSNSREIDVHRSRGGQMSKEKSKPCSKERGERRSREIGDRRSREKDERRSREKDERRSRERGERRSRERGERRSSGRSERRSKERGERRSKERMSQPFRPHDSRHKEDSSVEKATDTSRSISKVINKQVVATVTEPSLKFGEKRNTETSSAKERYLMRKAQMNVATYKTD